MTTTARASRNRLNIIGKGGTEYISAGGCTDEEYQTHFALWAMMNSSLMIGCDVRKMSEETKKILLNRDLIALNQDIECRAPFRVNCVSNSPDSYVLVKFLTSRGAAIRLFTMRDVPLSGMVQLGCIQHRCHRR